MSQDKGQYTCCSDMPCLKDNLNWLNIQVGKQHMDLQNILGYTGKQLLYDFDQCKVHEIHKVKGCKGLVTQLAQAL